MENYVLLKKLGAGSFGDVCAAFHKKTDETVAIKKLKNKCSSWQDCLALPEVEYSRSNLKHPHIVELKEYFREDDGTAFLVFECMESDLFRFMHQNGETKFSEAHIRSICHQILQGLHHMHKNGYFHCDLKPENLLVKQDVIKIGDFGSARKIGSGPFWDYVGTRWYRAPEVLLGSSSYDCKVDMWAVGAIMAELFNLRPLFPGTDGYDQMRNICRVIGSPTWESWREGHAWARNYGFPQFDGVGLSSAIPSASESAIQLIGSLLSWDPHKRPTAANALQHPFFVGSYRIPRAIPRATPQRHSKILPARLDCIFV